MLPRPLGLLKTSALFTRLSVHEHSVGAVVAADNCKLARLSTVHPVSDVHHSNCDLSWAYSGISFCCHGRRSNYQQHFWEQLQCLLWKNGWSMSTLLCAVCGPISPNTR
ncbi:hypothetical protein C8J56DRAFT_951861 [Mycena floridula]|nr:hypothetical protein C8J56DRAFT_951861 [Mycena floridula]